MKRRLLASVLFAAMCVISCGDQVTNTTTITNTTVTGTTYRVFGKVMDGANSGVEGIGIIITGVGVIDTTTTGEYGFYAFDGIPSGFYVVTVDTVSAAARLYTPGETEKDIAVLAADEQVSDYLVRGPYVKNFLRVSFFDANGDPIPTTSPAYHYIYVYLGSRVEPSSADADHYIYYYTIPLDYASMIVVNLYLGTSTVAVASADVEVFSMSGTRLSKEKVNLVSGSAAVTVETPTLMNDIRTK